MRYRFPIDLTAEEKTEHERIYESVRNWWKTFAEHSDDLRAFFKQKKKWDLVGWMRTHLDPISPDLMWEFGPGLFGGDRLVITPESNRHLRPLVVTILDLAPQLEGWEFYAYRLPEDVETARTTVDARGGARLDEMRFMLSQGEFNRVDVSCLVRPDYPHDIANATGFIAMETLLGEELLDRWIGYIDHEVVEEFPAGIVEADNLLKSVRRVVDEITASLADKPWIGRSQEAEWAAFRLEPQENNADYPKRKDQLTQISAIPDLHQCVFSSNGFDSVRFSKCGETFAYVKIDGADGLPEWGFKDRAEIEEALIAALETSQLGTVVGGGNGRRYCYIDLSLLDVNKAVSVIRETLARGGVSIRSWLLFFDSDYSAEWIGVFPDSPPPPMEDTGGKE